MRTVPASTLPSVAAQRELAAVAQVAVRDPVLKRLQWYDCPRHGGSLSVPGFSGALTCPRASTFCEQELPSNVVFPVANAAALSLLSVAAIVGPLLVAAACAVPVLSRRCGALLAVAAAERIAEALSVKRRDAGVVTTALRALRLGRSPVDATNGIDGRSRRAGTLGNGSGSGSGSGGGSGSGSGSGSRGSGRTCSLRCGSSAHPGPCTHSEATDRAYSETLPVRFAADIVASVVAEAEVLEPWHSVIVSFADLTSSFVCVRVCACVCVCVCVLARVRACAACGVATTQSPARDALVHGGARCPRVALRRGAAEHAGGRLDVPAPRCVCAHHRGHTARRCTSHQTTRRTAAVAPWHRRRRPVLRRPRRCLRHGRACVRNEHRKPAKLRRDVRVLARVVARYWRVLACAGVCWRVLARAGEPSASVCIFYRGWRLCASVCGCCWRSRC